jgi:tetratricopeptide (TPR) repeat protein
MAFSQIYKQKPEIYYKQILEEFCSKRDNKLYTEKDIIINFIEHKLGILVAFDNKTEKRYIEKGYFPVNEFDDKNIQKDSSDTIIINPWECEIGDQLPTDLPENKIIKNTYIINEQNKVCGSCGGTGKLVCNNCNGKGRIIDEYDGSKCFECNGHGFYICDVCNGTGKLKLVHSLVQELSKEILEKTFIIDEIGSVQIVHQKINTDIDFLTILTQEEITHGELGNILNNLGISPEMSENLIVSIIPFLERQEKEYKSEIRQIKLYSFPISLVYSKVRDNPIEVFTFVGKEFELVNKKELFKHSSELEKEFRDLATNLMIEKEEKLNQEKQWKKQDIFTKISNNPKLFLFSVLGSILLTGVLFVLIFFIFIKPTMTNENISLNTQYSILREFEPASECEAANTKEKIEALINLAENYAENESVSYAISTYKYLADCYIKSDNPKENINLYKRIAELYSILKNEEQSLDYYSKAFILAKDIEMVPEQAYFASILGDIHSNRYNYDKALKFYKVSSELYKRIGDVQKEINNIYKAGEIHLEREEISKAYDLFEYVLDYAEESKNNDILAKTLISIAEIEIKKGLDTKTTENYLQKAQLLSPEGLTKARLNLIYGRYHYNRSKEEDNPQQNLKTAETYYQRAGNLFLELEEYDYVATTLNSLGIILIEQGKLDEAEDKLLTALDIRNKEDNKADKASVMFNLANLYERKGNIQKAVDYMREVVNIGEELGLPYLKNDKIYLNKLEKHLEGISETKRKTTDEIIEEKEGEDKTEDDNDKTDGSDTNEDDNEDDNDGDNDKNNITNEPPIEKNKRRKTESEDTNKDDNVRINIQDSTQKATIEKNEE